MRCTAQIPLSRTLCLGKTEVVLSPAAGSRMLLLALSCVVLWELPSAKESNHNWGAGCIHWLVNVSPPSLPQGEVILKGCWRSRAPHEMCWGLCRGCLGAEHPLSSSVSFSPQHLPGVDFEGILATWPHADGTQPVSQGIQPKNPLMQKFYS